MRFLLSVFAALLLASGAGAQNLIVNGSFEDPAVPTVELVFVAATVRM